MRIYGLFLFLLSLLLLPQMTLAQTTPAQEQLSEETQPVPDTPRMEDMHIAVLRTIDKVSARTHTFEIPVDQTVKFGDSLFIKARACRKSSPLAQPEAAAFLQIWEKEGDSAEAVWVFSGWMFASSPSLSPMNHPVYDVWVIACKNSSTAKKSESAVTEETPPPDAATPVPAEKPAPVESPAPEGTDEETEVTADPLAPAPAADAAPKIEDLPPSFEENGED